MGNIGWPEILIVLLVIFVFFGAKKIPEIAKGLSEGIREFRKASHNVKDEEKKEEKNSNSKNETKPLG
jgi:sec-independent protein translocase protein TatA